MKSFIGITQNQCCPKKNCRKHTIKHFKDEPPSFAVVRTKHKIFFFNKGGGLSTRVQKMYPRQTRYGNVIQLLTGFEDNSSFVWPENGSATGWGQHIRSRVKQNCCCPKSQSITVLLYTNIFFKISYSLFPLTYPLDVFNILISQVGESGRRLDIVMSISRDLSNQWK